MFHINQNFEVRLAKTRFQTKDDYDKVSERIRSSVHASRLVISEPDPKTISIRAIYTEPLEKGYSEDEFFTDLGTPHGMDKLPFAVDEHERKVQRIVPEAPLLLGAGPSGSGKSVGAQALLASMMPAEGPKRLHLLDPKRVELSMWVPLADSHATGVEDMKSVVETVRDDTNTRYERMEAIGVRKLTDDPDLYEELGGTCVLVVDALAETLSAGGKDVGRALSSIAQLARAASVFLLVFTQRPSADLFSKSTGTETLRSNLSNLIAWRVLRRPDVDVILGVGAASEDGKDASKIPTNMPGAGYASFSDVMVRTPFISDDSLKGFIERIKDNEQVEPTTEGS